MSALAGLLAGAVLALALLLLKPEWLMRLRAALFAIEISPEREALRGALDERLKEAAPQGDIAMLGGVLDLRQLELFDVMIHRTKMTLIDRATPPSRIIEEVLKSGHTRVPVYEDNPDNITGILNAKDLLAALQAEGGDAARIDLGKIVTQPWFVPDTTAVADQLNAFLRRKRQLAIVVDEYGEVMGLVTLEDILEEIVGEIADEHDPVERGVRRQGDGSWIVDGAVPVRDLNRALGWKLPEAEATTLAGLVIHEARAIPESGQVFTFHGFRFEVLRKRRNRITALRAAPVARPAA